MTLPRTLTLTLAAAALAGAAYMVGRPQPEYNAMLGASWQCTRTALVLTSCSPIIAEVTSAVRTVAKR